MSALPHDATAPPRYAALFADRYDEWFAASTTDSTVGFLAALAKEGPPGPLLELGSGTGRVVLPLAALGLTVEGLDASPEMTAQLHAKPGGGMLRVTLGDFSAPPALRTPEDTRSSTRPGALSPNSTPRRPSAAVSPRSPGG